MQGVSFCRKILYDEENVIWEFVNGKIANANHAYL